jgi:[ribosomal protein S5]-alanine N-acetyltransferase
MNYFLKSVRLGFRCWSTEDLPLVMELWGDPEVTAFIGGRFTPEMVCARHRTDERIWHAILALLSLG